MRAADRPDRSDRLDPAATALCRACRRMAREGLIAGRAGNLSLRDRDTVYVTPRGVNKGHLRPAQVIVTLLARPADTVPGASVEYRAHRACYLAAPAVGAVVHTHAPALTALGLLGLDLSALPEAHDNMGGVALLPFQPSGSDELADAVAQAAAGGAGVVILSGHGAVAVGRDLDEACDRMSLAELTARAIVWARAVAAGGAAVFQAPGR